MGSPAAKSAYLAWLARALSRRPIEPAARAGVDVVMGYATGYDAADVAPFVRSLRAVHGGPVVMVVDPSPDFSAFLAAHDVEAVAAPQSEGWRPHPVMGRFAAYDRLLAARDDVRNVLLTDVRDVVFQASPFAPAPAPDRLEVFSEDDDRPLGRHAFNMKHLRALIGDEMAEALSDKPCLCVGTVLGPAAEARRLCRLILTLGAVPRSEVGGCFGADQAAFNLAVHLGLIQAEVRANHSRVATVGLSAGQGLSISPDGLRNPDGSLSAIVHQYDRHPTLVDVVHERWGRGLHRRERRRPTTLAARGRRLMDSVARRTPELREGRTATGVSRRSSQALRTATGAADIQ